MATRDINKEMVREQYFKLGETIKKAVIASDAYRKRLADLKLQKDTYAADYIEEQKGKMRSELSAKHATAHSDTKAQLEKLATALRELDQVDMGNPTLVSTLNHIHNVGKNLSFENIQQLNAQFAYDQPALKLLQSAYKAAGVDYDGGLDKQIYSVDSMMNEIGKAADDAFLHGGSINHFSSKVAKYAELEGHGSRGFGFEGTPDPEGANEVMLRAAGLPADS